MNTLMPYFRDWFLPKEEYFVALSNTDCRAEGWLKAEMIVLLTRLLYQGVIDSFQRELNLPRNDGTRQRDQIDFRIDQSGKSQLCELKSLCISQAAGTPRNLRFYFREDHLGLVKDFKKLDALPSNEAKWVLGFIYPCPETAIWSETIASLADRVSHWQCVTKPTEFPKFVFLSLWRQNKKTLHP